MLLLLIIAAIVIVVIGMIFPVLRTIIGIAILLGMVYRVIKFFVNLFKDHTIPTAIEILIKIAIVVAFSFVFLRILYFFAAWYGGV